MNSLLTSHARADVEPLDDAPDQSLDLPFGLVTVADVAKPQATDLKQAALQGASDTRQVPSEGVALV